MAGGTNNNQLKAKKTVEEMAAAVAEVMEATVMETATATKMEMVTATTPTLTPSALLSKQFLLCCLLLLSRLLIYSSSCCTFRHQLLSPRPPVSMTALPPPLSLQCPNASCCKTLMLTLVFNVFALRHLPLAECSCRVRSCVDPNAPPPLLMLLLLLPSPRCCCRCH
jgi:hypothetical protein